MSKLRRSGKWLWGFSPAKDSSSRWVSATRFRRTPYPSLAAARELKPLVRPMSHVLFKRLRLLLSRIPRHVEDLLTIFASIGTALQSHSHFRL